MYMYIHSPNNKSIIDLQSKSLVRHYQKTSKQYIEKGTPMAQLSTRGLLSCAFVEWMRYTSKVPLGKLELGRLVIAPLL